MKCSHSSNLRIIEELVYLLAEVFGKSHGFITEKVILLMKLYIIVTAIRHETQINIEIAKPYKYNAFLMIIVKE